LTYVLFQFPPLREQLRNRGMPCVWPDGGILSVPSSSGTTSELATVHPSPLRSSPFSSLLFGNNFGTEPDEPEDE